MVRFQFHGPAVAGDRFVQFPLVFQYIAQVVVCFGKVGLEFQGPAVAGNRFGNPVQRAIGLCEIVVEGRRPALQPDRPLHVLDGHLVLARLVSNYAEKMPRIGLVWFGLQDLPIDLLGSLQATGLMVLDCERQCLGNRCHGVDYDNAKGPRQ